MKLISSLLILWGVSSQTLPAQISGVTVEVKLEQDQFLPGEDLVAAIRVTNLSGQKIVLGKDRDWLSFSIEARDNYAAPKIADPPVEGELALESSLAGTRRVNLTPYFNFRQPGRYRVTATLHLPEWNLEASSAPKTFDVISGTRLKEIEFGVPPSPGRSNSPPEMRKYVLQQSTYLKQLKLYFRLTDISGSQTFRVYPIGLMTSDKEAPEAQVDRGSNLHVLHKIGAHSFNYSVFNPDGEMTLRQTYDYADSRPRLRGDVEGNVFVGGGVRRVAANDLPMQVAGAPAQETGPAPEADVKNPVKP